MDWVHCNNCCVQPSQGPDKPRFFLTNCGHIFCKKCSMECSNNVCLVCGAIFKAVMLTSKMKPEIERFFMNPLDLLKRSINEVHSVTEFQQGHRTRLLDQLTRKLRHQETSIKEYDSKCRCLQTQLRKLEEQVRQYQQQRAAAYSPSTGFLAGTVASRPYRRTPQGAAPSPNSREWTGAGSKHPHQQQQQRCTPVPTRSGSDTRTSPYMDLATRHFQPSPSTSGLQVDRRPQSPRAARASQTLLAKLFASPGVPRTHNFI